MLNEHNPAESEDEHSQLKNQYCRDGNRDNSAETITAYTLPAYMAI